MTIKDKLYIGLIALLILIYIFKPVNSGKIQKLQEDNIALKKDIASKQDSINKLTAKQVPLEINIDSLVNLYKKNQIFYVENIKELKIKDSIVNTYSVTELEQFFSDYCKDHK